MGQLCPVSYVANSTDTLRKKIIPQFLQQGSRTQEGDLQKDYSQNHQPSDTEALQSEGVSAATKQGDVEPFPNGASDPAGSQDPTGRTTTSSTAPSPSAAVASTASPADTSSMLQSDTIDLDAMPEAWLSEDALAASGGGEAIDISLAADLATGLMLEGEGGGQSDVKKQD